MKVIICMQGCQNKPATAHFTVYSEKCASFSECLWLNFQHGGLSVYHLICITVWFLKIILATQYI